MCSSKYYKLSKGKINVELWQQEQTQLASFYDVSKYKKRSNVVNM